MARHEGLTELTKEHLDILKFVREVLYRVPLFLDCACICKNVDQEKDQSGSLIVC